MKKITVVIPNFNGMQYVERCLDSLERQTFSDFDVIFVDNGSVDGSRELTEKKYPWVKKRLLRIYLRMRNYPP